MVKQAVKSKGRKNKYWCIWALLAVFCLATVIVIAGAYAASARLPQVVGHVLTGTELEKVKERNSPLIDYVHLSANADFPRTSKISKITIHHMAGNLSLEKLGESFGKRDRKASASYAVDSAGRVALYVEEQNRPWSSADFENDNMAVTIEVANDTIGGDWHVSDAAYEKLIELCTDICRRNGIEELIYTGDASGNLTTHKMFLSQTECPGPYLESRMSEIANAVNANLRQ